MTRVLLATVALAAVSVADELPVIEPAPEHRLLKKMVGTWSVVQKVWPKPGAPAAEANGTMVTRSVAGGLAIAYEYTSPATDHAPAFHGYGLTAWIPARKHFEAWWFDSMSVAGMGRSTGTWDPGAKTLTERMVAPGPDQKPVEFKVVTRVETDDRHRQTFYVMKDGEEIGKMMELSFTRSKAPSEAAASPVAPGR